MTTPTTPAADAVILDKYGVELVLALRNQLNAATARESALVAERDALRAALQELRAAECAVFPAFEDGEDAQDAWAIRLRSARDGADAALALSATAVEG